jgi:sugar lactone lactonase YvrE
MIHDKRICALGEGPLWHPERNRLFWCDILGKRLLTSGEEWPFDGYVSAAGWVDESSLLLATDTALLRFDIDTGEYELICPLEADNPDTRSNDGRADPWGGFWIGTMGVDAQPDAGAIYRYFRGELRQLYAPLTIPNAICFSPDRCFAYFTDTRGQKIMRQPLAQSDGWPEGAPQIWLDLRKTGWFPDGAVVDAAGNFWNAQWGGYRVACYSPEGKFLRAVRFGAAQTSCPAFGGPELSHLFCTSAAVGLSADDLKSHPNNGKTFVKEQVAKGQPEHQVIL